VKIVGVSFASTPAQNSAWAADEGFAFELWTDEDRTLSEVYDAGHTSFANTRVTKLLDANGDLVPEYIGVNANIAAHPSEVLSDCQVLFGDP